MRYIKREKSQKSIADRSIIKWIYKYIGYVRSDCLKWMSFTNLYQQGYDGSGDFYRSVVYELTRNASFCKHGNGCSGCSIIESKTSREKTPKTNPINTHSIHAGHFTH